MALVSNVTYNGKQSFDFFSAAFYNNDLLPQFNIMTGVKNSEIVPNVSLSGITVADSCDFESAGTITIDPRTISVCSMKINQDICYNEIEPTFLSERMRLGATSPITPSEFTDYVLRIMTEKVGNDVQNIFWNGDTGLTANPTLSLCNGLIKLLGATSSGVVTVSGTTVSSSNVITELGKVFAAIPEQIAGNVVIYVPYAIAQAYKIAQAATTGGLFMVGEKELNFNGVPIFVAPFMPANKMVAANPANIWIATDLESDYSSFTVKDLWDITVEPKVRIAARWKFGVQVGVPAEIVYYRQ